MNKTLIAILVPIIALAGWLGSLSYHIATSQTIRVKVQGYDPRDLLAGHYINFSLTIDAENPCKDTYEDTADSSQFCVCYGPSADGIFHQPTWGGRCESKPENCTVYLKGGCRWHRFITGVERYSFPEYLAPVLGTLAQNSSALLSVNSSGKAHVLQLYTDEKTIEEYASEKLSAQYQMEVLQETPTTAEQE